VALDSFLIELNRRSARFASRDGDNRLGLDWLHNGTLRVGSRAWAVWSGLSGRSCMWSPKLSGGNLGVLQMVDYASGLDALKRIEGNRDLGAGGASRLDLVCVLLVEASQVVLRQGLSSARIHSGSRREPNQLVGAVLCRGEQPQG
jgi:hypothetical protein